MTTDKKLRIDVYVSIIFTNSVFTINVRRDMRLQYIHHYTPNKLKIETEDAKNFPSLPKHTA